MIRLREMTRVGVSAVRREPAQASWTAAVDTISALVYAVVAMGSFTMMVVPAAADAAANPSAIMTVMALYLAAQVLSVADLAAHGRDRARFLPLVLILGLGAIMLAFHTISPRLGDALWWPLNILSMLAIYLIAVTCASRTAWLATLLAVGGVLLSVFVTLPINAEDQLRLGVNHLMVVAALVATADLFTRGLRRIAVESDLVDVQRINDLRSTSRAGREANRLRDAERYIHDEVLHILRAVAMDRADLPGSQVRAWSQKVTHELSYPSLRERVGGGSSPASAVLSPAREAQGEAAYSDLVMRLEALELPMRVEWTMPRTALLPTQVTDAIVAATAEAVRNAARHSGELSVHVHLKVSATAVRVSIRDDGRGFDPREPRLTRHGVARSVLGRMNDLGGTATIQSAPGEGTTVTLHWAARVPRVGGRSFPWNDHTVRDLVRRCILMLFPSSIAAVVLVATSIPHLQWPALALAAVAVLCVVVVMVPRTSLRAGLGRWASAGLLALGVAVALAFGFAVAPGEGGPVNLAALPYAALIPAVILFTRPLWEGFIAWLLMTAVALAVTLGYVGTVQDLVAMWPLIISPGFALGVALMMRFAIDLYGSSTYFAIEARARAHGEAHRTEAVRASVVSRLDRVNASVRTFLGDVATGRIDTADPTVRTQAGELERAVREDLSLGEAPGIRDAIELLRQGGATVGVRVPADPPAEVDRVVHEIVATLLSAPSDTSEFAHHDPALPRILGAVGSTSLGLTVTPRAEAWTVALLARITSETHAEQIAEHWRSSLAHLGVTVMTIGGDVRARAVVTVADDEIAEAQGRRDA